MLALVLMIKGSAQSDLVTKNLQHWSYSQPWLCINLQVQLSTTNPILPLMQLACHVVLQMVGYQEFFLVHVLQSSYPLDYYKFLLFAVLNPERSDDTILLYKFGVGVCIFIALASVFTLIVVLILCLCAQHKRTRRGENIFTLLTMHKGFHGMLIKQQVSRLLLVDQWQSHNIIIQNNVGKRTIIYCPL